MKLVKLNNGEEIHYLEIGDRQNQTLVLIHGNMTSSVHFDLLIGKLKHSYHIIALDLRGFGQSTYKNPISSLKEFAEDVNEVISHIGVTKAVVLGWSTGGGIAMELALLRPELLEKLILVESVGLTGYPMFKKDELGQPILTEPLTTKEEIAADPVQVIPILNAYEQKDKATLQAIWNALIYTVNQPEASHYDVYLEDMLTQKNLVDVDYALMTLNLSERAKDINVPTLIFQGTRDYVVPESMGIGIRDNLGGSVTYQTGDWGHSPFIDCLDKVVEDIKAFI